MFDPPPHQDPRSVTKDLQRDPGIVLIDRYFWVPQAMAIVLLFGLGLLYDLYTACSWVIWGVGVRTAFTYQITWLVNSGCHLWGYKNFNTKDQSRNNWWIALLSFGEGWHENHHHEERSAAHGNRRWYELDITYWTILLMEKLGLATDVKRPTKFPV
jgi:stearoyl-CoA desaturase (delta-9 desaturase)